MQIHIIDRIHSAIISRYGLSVSPRIIILSLILVCLITFSIVGAVINSIRERANAAPQTYVPADGPVVERSVEE